MNLNARKIIVVGIQMREVAFCRKIQSNVLVKMEFVSKMVGMKTHALEKLIKCFVQTKVNFVVSRSLQQQPQRLRLQHRQLPKQIMKQLPQDQIIQSVLFLEFFSSFYLYNEKKLIKYSTSLYQANYIQMCSIPVDSDFL